MNSKETVQSYFNAFAKNEGWENFAADDIVFEGPMPRVIGKQAWVELTKKFIMGVTKSSLDLSISENDKVALTATYDMALPTGDIHSLKTMEIYSVKDGKISHILISFDTASFNEFMAKMPEPKS